MGEELYVHKHSTELSVGDCRDLKRACTHAREIGRPLNTLATLVLYPGSLPSPEARAHDLNRFLTHIRGLMKRRLDETWCAGSCGSPSRFTRYCTGFARRSANVFRL